MKYLYRRILAGLGGLRAAVDAAPTNNLDHADTPVSSLTPASTALSNAVWTNARAGCLDEPISATQTASNQSSFGAQLTAANSNIDIPFSSFGTPRIKTIRTYIISGAIVCAHPPGEPVFYTGNYVADITPVADTSKSFLLLQDDTASGDYGGGTPIVGFSSPSKVIISYFTTKGFLGVSGVLTVIEGE